MPLLISNNTTASGPGGARKYQCFPVGAYAVFDDIPAGFQAKIMPKINEFNAAAAGGMRDARRRDMLILLYPPYTTSDTDTNTLHTFLSYRYAFC